MTIKRITFFFVSILILNYLEFYSQTFLNTFLAKADIVVSRAPINRITSPFCIFDLNSGIRFCLSGIKVTE